MIRATDEAILAVMDKLAGDVYVAAYDFPGRLDPRSHYTDLDLEPYRVSRIHTVELQHDGFGRVASQGSLTLQVEKPKFTGTLVMVLWNDEGLPVWSERLRDGRVFFWDHVGLVLT